MTARLQKFAFACFACYGLGGGKIFVPLFTEGGDML
jgi:hypothetical protein